MFRDLPGLVAQVTQIIEIKACSGLVKASEDSELLRLLKSLKLLHVWTPQGTGRWRVARVAQIT
jgi:hypothetical protein